VHKRTVIAQLEVASGAVTRALVEETTIKPI